MLKTIVQRTVDYQRDQLGDLDSVLKRHLSLSGYLYTPFTGLFFNPIAFTVAFIRYDRNGFCINNRA